MEIEYNTNKDVHPEELNALAKTQGWEAGRPIAQNAEAIAGSVFVASARHEGRLVGILRLIGDGAYYLHIADLIVHPDFQRKGIGRELLERGLAYARAGGIGVDDNSGDFTLFANVSADVFYEKFGFKTAPNGMVLASSSQRMQHETAFDKSWLNARRMHKARKVQSPNAPNALIMAPMKAELDPLIEVFRENGSLGKELSSKTAAHSFQDLGVVVAMGGHGKAEFGARTQYMIDDCGPFDSVIIAGSAGALDNRLVLGDIVIGTETVEHDYKNRFSGNNPPPRHQNSGDLGKAIRTAAGEAHHFRAYSGPIASGDEDIVDETRARELSHSTGALCVAWEGAGGAKAARFSDIPFLEIRAITDAADAGTVESFRRHLPGAMRNIGKILYPWLSKRLSIQ